MAAIHIGDYRELAKAGSWDRAWITASMIKSTDERLAARLDWWRRADMHEVAGHTGQVDFELPGWRIDLCGCTLTTEKQCHISPAILGLAARNIRSTLLLAPYAATCLMVPYIETRAQRIIEAMRVIENSKEYTHHYCYDESVFVEFENLVEAQRAAIAPDHPLINHTTSALISAAKIARRISETKKSMHEAKFNKSDMTRSCLKLMQSSGVCVNQLAHEADLMFASRDAKNYIKAHVLDSVRQDVSEYLIAKRTSSARRGV